MPSTRRSKCKPRKYGNAGLAGNCLRGKHAGNHLMAGLLKAGVRGHNRFYKKLAAENFDQSSAGNTVGRTLQKILSKILPSELLKGASAFRLAFEVDLGRRRPDCICMFTLSGGLLVEGCNNVCVIIELKTCRFYRNLKTASKNEQRATGTKQLLESKTLIERMAPKGSDHTIICPVLVFVARRGLVVIRSTPLKKKAICTDFHRLASMMYLRSEYRLYDSGMCKPMRKICHRNKRTVSTVRRMRCGISDTGVLPIEKQHVDARGKDCGTSGIQGEPIMQRMRNIISHLSRRH
uniref:UL24 n=1 Tax=Meleagrid herpesvirus 1 TaxID=37108 RepID=Q9E1G8_MEHV1|nr:UL24 [Meleagrid alphaherpesvirus 1]